MNKLLDRIQLTAPKKNSFDLSAEKKMSVNMAKLYPILVQDVIPGDRFKVSTEILARAAPMLAPIFHKVDVTTHYFFVPNRIVWNDWEAFITGGEDGNELPNFPKMAFSEANKAEAGIKTLADYMGIPTIDPADTVTNQALVSCLPFRAYQTIYNEYYRDQNLTEKIVFGLGSTVPALETTELATLRTRAWEKDYFTSALPWAQRGGDVSLPIENSYSPQYLDQARSSVLQAGSIQAPTASGDLNSVGTASLPTQLINLEPQQTIDSTSVTINELRKATALQRWLEKSARGGSRYAEQLLSFWGVRSSDARLQRPEYLGGGKSNLQISEVLSTVPTAISATDPLGPQGNMAGHGISMGKSNSFTKSFEEHGYIIGIMSILPRTGYQQGIEKHWLKFDKFDFPWPQFAQLGEQEIIDSELYHDYTGVDQSGEETFGYQSRYAEYKFKQNTTHGDMRGNLDFWHLNRIFTAKPNLNTFFVEADPDTRIWPAELPSEDHFYIQLYNKVKVLRALPYFNNPNIR